MPGKKTSWLRGLQEAGVPASLDTHPLYSGEENPSMMQETIHREHTMSTHNDTPVHKAT